MTNNPIDPFSLESFHVGANKLVLARRRYEVSADKVFDAVDLCQEIVSERSKRRWFFQSNHDEKLDLAKSALEEAKRVETNAKELYESCIKMMSSYNACHPSLKVRCTVTGITGYSFQIGSAHVLPSTSPRDYFKKFGIVKSDDTKNSMVLCGNVEAAYNERRLSFEISDLGAFKMRIWDPRVRNWPVFDGSHRRVGEFENVEFDFPEGRMPETKVLSFHAECGYKGAVRVGWISSSVERPALYGSPLINDTIICDMRAFQDEECEDGLPGIEPVRQFECLSVTSNDLVKAQKRISL